MNFGSTIEKRLIIAMVTIVVLLLTASLSVLALLPIYPDEFLWKIISSRMLLDNFRATYFFPQCSAGYELSTPVSWIPARLLDAMLYADAANPEKLRLFGIATYVGLCTLISMILHRTTGIKSLSGFGLALIVVFSASSFGVIQPLLIMNRPEQAILVPFTIMVALYVSTLSTDGSAPSRLSQLGYGTAFVLLTWVMLAGHIKSFVLIPAILLMLWALLRRPVAFFISSALILFGLFETYAIWSLRTICPEMPHLQTVFSGLALSPKLLLESPGHFFKVAVQNLLQIPDYITATMYAQNYQADWYSALGTPVGLPEIISNTLLFGSALLQFAAIIGGGGVALFRQKLPRSLFSLGGVSLAIVLGLFGLAAYQSTKNFYEAAIFWPLLAIAASLAAGTLSTTILKRWMPRIGLLVVGAAVFGQVLLLWSVVNNSSEWSARMNLGRSAIDEVNEVSAACNLHQSDTHTRLVLDYPAYSRFWSSDRPVMFDFFVGWWAEGLDRNKAIKEWPIDALIAECERFPADLLARAHASSSRRYCCADFR